jgi:hypothetical protein
MAWPRAQDRRHRVLIAVVVDEHGIACPRCHGRDTNPPLPEWRGHTGRRSRCTGTPLAAQRISTSVSGRHSLPSVRPLSRVNGSPAGAIPRWGLGSPKAVTAFRARVVQGPDPRPRLHWCPIGK